MHKITKGLKKKKKGKKSKHKDEELFKPEELEAYRREHQGASDDKPAQNEEWKKFLALTSGVDDILQKTQGDLNRIKSTSFFQRVPPPSELKKQEEELRAEQQAESEAAAAAFQEAQPPTEAELGIVQVSESESEEEDEDDIFDTAYIEALATGEVKLAYIPESPTDPAEGDDPFDTSYAERAILGPTVVDKRGKKLVTLGSAVEVLTGRAVLPTCATQRPPSKRRQVLKNRDLLLGSFDDNANSIAVEASPEPVAVEVTKSLLDDDPLPLSDEPIDLSKTLHQIPQAPVKNVQNPQKDKTKEILQQFDVITKVEDEDDKEFEALATESLSKCPTVITALPVLPLAVLPTTDVCFEAFADEKSNTKPKDFEEEEEDVDPFDTTFAENILPGKAELKIIENEILNSDLDSQIPVVKSKVSINITYPSGKEEVVPIANRIAEEELTSIKPIHRDLLGGSNTDLANFGDAPLQPAQKLEDDYIEYSDPFDTSIVDVVKQPGQTELKFLERELLADIKPRLSLSDDEFDPRATEEKPRERTVSRPDVLNFGPAKTVSFDVPSPEKDLLGTSNDHRTVKPLTPFYVRKNSVPEAAVVNTLPDVEEDPFDTSFVAEVAPGKAELKLIENELFDPDIERRLSLTDHDFDPRDDKKAALATVVESIKEISNPKPEPPKLPEPIDLLSIGSDIAVKVLTPCAQVAPSLDEFSYTDPFDTSAATNILPGKTELKLLESELLAKDSENFDDFDPRAPAQSERLPKDLLETTDDVFSDKPLTPIPGIVSFDEEEEVDPFDTSFANNIQPGRAELKLLETELISN